MKRTTVLIVSISLAFAQCKKEGDDDSSMLALLAAGYLGRPIAMINMGDSLTNGTQSGVFHEYTQVNGFTQLLANQMLLRGTLPWNNPLLYATGGSAGTRKDASAIPYNVGVNGQTLKDMVNTAAVNGGTATVDKLLAPIPSLRGSNTTQLQAAQYLGTLNPDRTLIITLWIGNNDVLGAVTASSGSALTTSAINTFLADTAAQHDLTNVKANLTTVIDTLKTLPNAHIFIANLPDVSGIAFVADQTDITRLAHTTDTLNITSFGSCTSLGFGGLIGTSTANSILNNLDANNATLNAVLGGYAGTDGTCLTSTEAALVSTRVNEINAHIQTLVSANSNVHLVDMNSFFSQVVGGQVSVNGRTLRKTLLQGGAFSFDGVHPSNTGYALAANAFIAVINSSLTLNIPYVDVPAVNLNDPYRDADGDGFAPGPTQSVSPVSASIANFKDCDDTNTAKYAQIVHGGGGATSGTCP